MFSDRLETLFMAPPRPKIISLLINPAYINQMTGCITEESWVICLGQSPLPVILPPLTSLILNRTRNNLT